MTLEFEKIISQVERMGRMIAHMSEEQSKRAENAWDILAGLSDPGAIWQRIKLVRERNAGYRGAGTPDLDKYDIVEPLNRPYPLPPAPSNATILAADGSQIYPDPHAAALYYLLNIAVFVYYHGDGDLPDTVSEPSLHYAESDVRNEQGNVIAAAEVNARRTVRELAMLYREAWTHLDRPCPLLAISDGPLLWWVGKDVPNRTKLMDEYLGFLSRFYDIHANIQQQHQQHAGLIGYVDRPTKPHLVNLVHLMHLEEGAINRGVFDRQSEFSGLHDAMLMVRLLQAGERSAIMVQQAPRNKEFRERGEKNGQHLEIAFFYLHVGNHIVRVELPMWVARNTAMVDHVHALLYDQCQMMWRYPYALTRADELAVIRASERKHLEQLIETEMRKQEQPVEHSQKSASKSVRHGRTKYGQSRR